MHLENSEQIKASGKREPIGEVMLLSPKLSADLSKGEPTKTDSGIICKNTDFPKEHGVFCNTFEQYPTNNGFLNLTSNECETSGLSQGFDKCECFKLCEFCANLSLASECVPRCEQCAQHLRLFQQCKLTDRSSVVF